MFHVITDTSANLPSDLAQRQDITVIPLPYFVNGARHTCLDTEGFDGETFYGGAVFENATQEMLESLEGSGDFTAEEQEMITDYFVAIKK